MRFRGGLDFGRLVSNAVHVPLPLSSLPVIKYVDTIPAWLSTTMHLFNSKNITALNVVSL